VYGVELVTVPRDELQRVALVELVSDVPRLGLVIDPHDGKAGHLIPTGRPSSSRKEV
jgi:hypothetical protein